MFLVLCDLRGKDGRRDIYTYMVVMNYNLQRKTAETQFFPFRRMIFLHWQPTKVPNTVYFLLFKVLLGIHRFLLLLSIAVSLFFFFFLMEL